MNFQAGKQRECNYSHTEYSHNILILILILPLGGGQKDHQVQLLTEWPIQGLKPQLWHHWDSALNWNNFFLRQLCSYAAMRIFRKHKRKILLHVIF